MLDTNALLDAMSGVREEDILAAGRAMGYLPGGRKQKKNLWRPLLIAAALTALLTATAVAAAILGRAQRLAPMPTDPSGMAQQAEIPNGFRGSPTYQGSSQWWEYRANWDMAHNVKEIDYSLDFTEGDLDRYLVCSLYEAYDREQADKLYEIARQYDLQLYRETVYFGQDPEEFYSLTGVAPFLAQKDLGLWGGHVLEDGSFTAEISLGTGLERRGCDIRRYYTGSIYPFGGAGRIRPYEETEYMTARGFRVYIDVFGPGEAEITYTDPTGETYITLDPYIDPTESALEQCRQAADLVDFEALCQRDTRQVLALLNQPTGAEKNPQAVQKLREFQASPAFQAAKEFSGFYTANFYGPCFTGTYGMEGCGDIDRELDRLGSTYGLRFAREKTRGNADFPRAAVFDSGAWQVSSGRGGRSLHYIPKDALYTMMTDFLDVRAYRRIWDYETKEGQQLVLCTQGPIHSVHAGGYALLETEDAYVKLDFYGGSPQRLEWVTEEFDWTVFSQRRETK